jgi:transposase-like protein
MFESPASGPIYIALYRAVDSTGGTIDFFLSARRNAAAARHFFQRHCGLRITLVRV